MGAFHDFYRGRRVLVTGDTGFKGSWLAFWLTRLGANVTGYSNGPLTEPNNYEALALPDTLKHVSGLVEDNDALADAIRAAEPEVIFHLAGQALVGRSFEQPRETIATNVLGTANLLDAAISTGSVRSVVSITSDKCYAPRDGDAPYGERDELGGEDPYSLSKACAEFVVKAFAATVEQRASDDTTFPAIASARAGNVFGGGDWSEMRLIPDIVRAIDAREPLVLRFPHARRPWQHVLEPLSGYLWLGRLLALEEVPTGIWNFGPPPQGAHTVEEMVRTFLTEWHVDIPIELMPQTNFEETLILRLDPTRAERELGWRTVLEPKEALALTAAWYRTFYEGDRPMADVTAQQIDEYVEHARASGLEWAK